MRKGEGALVLMEYLHVNVRLFSYGFPLQHEYFTFLLYNNKQLHIALFESRVKVAVTIVADRTAYYAYDHTICASYV